MPAQSPSASVRCQSLRKGKPFVVVRREFTLAVEPSVR